MSKKNEGQEAPTVGSAMSDRLGGDDPFECLNCGWVWKRHELAQVRPSYETEIVLPGETTDGCPKCGSVACEPMD